MDGLEKVVQSKRDAQHLNTDAKVNQGDRDGRVVGRAAMLNWAWATMHSHYDWMDSHAPFNLLDQ